MSNKSEIMLRSLRGIEAMYKGEAPETGKPNVARIAHDAAECIESLMKNPESGMNELAREIHENAIAHGWWDGQERKLPEILMLTVSELAEALEEYRDGAPLFYCDAYDENICGNCMSQRGACVQGNRKPEGIAVELADAIIRILDYCGKAEINIESVIRLKHEYNKTRPYRHGGKAC